jgi:hypothetical protein
MPVGVLTGTAFTDPPCTDGEPVLALAGGDPKDNVKDHKIYNPVTGRYVLKHTPLGKKLVAPVPSKETFSYRGYKYTVFVGQRGGKYIKRNGTYMPISRLK